MTFYQFRYVPTSSGDNRLLKGNDTLGLNLTYEQSYIHRFSVYYNIQQNLDLKDDSLELLFFKCFERMQYS